MQAAAGVSLTEMYRFAAFISYSSKDRTFAQRLHKALEAYSIPKSLGQFDLIGESERPNRIYPIFRDRDELPSGDLGKEINAALRASSALIVIGSEDSAASQWVEKEVAYFKNLPQGKRIFGIVSPEADVSRRDVLGAFFPPAMASADAEHVAADARTVKFGGDGFRMAMLKVVAGLIERRAGDLVDRDRRRRRSQALALTIGAAAVLIAGLAGLRLAIAPMIQAEVMVARENTRRDIQRVEAARRVEVELAGLAARAWMASETSAVQTGVTGFSDSGLRILRDGLQDTRYEPNQLPLAALEFVRYAGVAHEERISTDRSEMLRFIAQARGVSEQRANGLWNSPRGQLFDSSVERLQNHGPFEQDGPGGRQITCDVEQSATGPTLIQIRRNGANIRTHRLPMLGCGVMQWSPQGSYVAMTAIHVIVVFDGENGELIARLPMCDRAFVDSSAPPANCMAATHAIVINESTRRLAIISLRDAGTVGHMPGPGSAISAPRPSEAEMRIYDFGAIEQMSMAELLEAEARQRAVAAAWNEGFTERDYCAMNPLCDTNQYDPIRRLTCSAPAEFWSATDSGEIKPRAVCTGTDYRTHEIDLSEQGRLGLTTYVSDFMTGYSYSAIYARHRDGVCGAIYAYRGERPNPLAFESANEYFLWSRSDQQASREGRYLTRQELSARASGCVSSLREILAGESQ